MYEHIFFMKCTKKYVDKFTAKLYSYISNLLYIKYFAARKIRHCFKKLI